MEAGAFSHDEYETVCHWISMWLKPRVVCQLARFKIPIKIPVPGHFLGFLVPELPESFFLGIAFSGLFN
jgi:hypothetical protein